MHGLGRHRITLDDQWRRPGIENPRPDSKGRRPLPRLQISASCRSAIATSVLAKRRTRMLPRPSKLRSIASTRCQRRRLSLSTREIFPSSRSRRNSIPSIEVLKSCRTKDVFYVPGEHDVLNDGGKLYRDRYLKSVEGKGSGWYSFNKNGVHFIGLVNVLDLQAGGLGTTRRRAT